MERRLLCERSMLSSFHVPIGWGELLKRTFNETLADDVFNLAAQQAYYFFFALFPALLALISFASFFPVHDLKDEVFNMFGRVAPGDVLKMVTEQLDKISSDNAGGLLTIAFLFTLWSSSGAVVSMCSTLNAAYGITEGRSWWKVRLTAIGLTVALSIFILVSMTLIVAGPTLARVIADSMRLGPAFEWSWLILQWPLVFLLVATAIAMLYYYAPDAKQEWLWITPGSVFATLLWVVISLGFKVYVANFGNYTETYGVIGGVMMLLLWFYLSAIAILVGAEMNAEIEHASPHGKDVGEKIPGEKKVIGPMAAQEYEKKKASGEIPVKLFPEGVNCDIDRKASPPEHTVRPSDLLIGAAALLPAAIKIGRAVKKQIVNRPNDEDDNRAA
ncbi:MAG: YihY/virulence factor BrkB family protein [Acidobacteria bacterium]|nr:YihY/virulence factor BrkB family protein [Acidobacteriota bacterium]